jgi:hypothetical protein
MYSISHSRMAVRTAKQQIDEQVRDAEAHRLDRAARHEARASSATLAPRRRWRFRLRSIRSPHPTGGGA